MCGIVGLFIKDKALEPRLGELLTEMLITMSDRGPDSAGIAVYRSDRPSHAKLTVQSDNPKLFKGLEKALEQKLDVDVTVSVIDTHAVIDLAEEKLADARSVIKKDYPALRIMSAGEAIEIYKEVGLPGDVARRFAIPHLRGSHGIGHTRMATESAVTTLGAHPFSTGPDQCLVHNGSLSNHNALRRKLKREDVTVETEN
ncbi:MAG: glutamine amidotransferase, partial [Pseudomonadota bacterium]